MLSITPWKTALFYLWKVNGPSSVWRFVIWLLWDSLKSKYWILLDQGRNVYLTYKTHQELNFFTCFRVGLSHLKEQNLKHNFHNSAVLLCSCGNIIQPFNSLLSPLRKLHASMTDPFEYNRFHWPKFVSTERKFYY